MTAGDDASQPPYFKHRSGKLKKRVRRRAPAAESAREADGPGRTVYSCKFRNKNFRKNQPPIGAWRNKSQGGLSLRKLDFCGSTPFTYASLRGS